MSRSHEQGADVVICTYRVKAGKEEAFLDLLRRHWPRLKDLGLVRGEPSRVYRGGDDGGVCQSRLERPRG